ncbi:MAG: livQ 1 [Glaciihabitans sp.]|nr:livQ 1 [Glaciihabitans sp.]
MTDTTSTDVLIVGSGIMGAAVAQLLREADPNTRITMIDGGQPIGGTPGIHLHDVNEPELWARYNERVASGIQGLYIGADVTDTVADDVRDLEPGMFHSQAFGENASAMPASSVAWNTGGMGVHWTAATPWPAGHEIFDGGDPAAWNADLDTARRLLDVSPSPIGPTMVGEIVINVLREALAGTAPAGREPQPMPMAVKPTESGLRPRTSPATMFPPIGGAVDDNFTLLTGTLATRILVSEDGDRALGARVRTVADGTVWEIFASSVIVCADTLRTPQLLFASGIRPEALGRYLNEHAFITGRVLMDLDRFGVRLDELPLARDGEFCTDSLWIPQNGPAQPFHGQVMNNTYVDEAGAPLAYSVGMSLYTPVESRPENRLVFSETETDIAGMPKISIEFGYSDGDLGLIDQAMAQLQSLAEDFGDFDPATERLLLSPGSSLHLTGTVRSGETNDGTSVCDTDGRVWGFDNLFVAGNGVIPTAVVANSTLTGTITAVRAARAVSRRLSIVSH